MAMLTRDGVQLAHVERGAGDPPVLLVHGWCCDHSYFAPQQEHLARRHRTVAVDLRGHGASDKPVQDYTVAAFADDLTWLAHELGLHRPIVIGHSLGGVIALALAARRPELPLAIVACDSPILSPQVALTGLLSLIPGLHGLSYREAQREFVNGRLFAPQDDAARRAQIVDTMSNAPQHVMASVFEQVFAFDHEAAARACRVPFLYIAGDPPQADLEKLRGACPGLVFGQTVGAGHFHQLEVPEQVNAMLDRFIAGVARKPD
jgi:pimeloyl-ACP methyl ester carboxylesterase